MCIRDRFIPDTAKEKPMQGEIMAVGPGKVGDDGKNIAMEVKVSDKVLYGKYSGTEVNKKIFMPLIYISIVWALSIHTVTAYLIATLPARPMWHHSMMPIRFIVTAFAAGPCLIILIFRIIRSNTKFWIEDEAINLLSVIVTWCLGLALFLSLSEIVIELYARTEHANGLYLSLIHI